MAVKEAGRGQWDAGPGLTEEALKGWLGEQEDRIADLKERLDQKQRELVRHTKVEEEEVSGLDPCSQEKVRPPDPGTSSSTVS